MDFKGILISAMEFPDETVLHYFARAMVQIKKFVLIKWCGVYSNQILIKDSLERAARFDCSAKT